jgi:hypothetical protein
LDALSALAITEAGIETRALDPDRKEARNELNKLLMSLPRSIRDRLLALFEQFTGKKVGPFARVQLDLLKSLIILIILLAASASSLCSQHVFCLDGS